MSNNIISYHSLNKLFTNIERFDTNKIKKKKNSFGIELESNPKYIQPNFTELLGNIKEGKKPKIVLISAPGATGKSELTKYLSSSCGVPIFDLSMHEPVASNSLTGLFYETLGATGLGIFVEELQKGKSALIIDAIDEGYLKTTIDGYNSFLDGVVDICKEAIETPFILLGRTQVIEYTWLYLDGKGISTSMLKIEPFTIEQAIDFLDKQISEQKYNDQYKQVRNFIINSVEGFFKNTSAIGKGDYHSFIGYAPVLLSITKLLKDNGNYKGLYEELTNKNDRGIDLIISIIEYILTRDKEEKVDKLVLPNLLKDRPKEFSAKVMKTAYSIEEQCARVLSIVTSIPIVIEVSDDPVFNNTYEEKLDSWVKEHPFLENNKLQNSVFESYILAQLMQNEAYSHLVNDYIRNHYKDAFMLFFIFDKISASRKIKAEYFQTVYSSLKSLDSTDKIASLDISESELASSESDHMSCELLFTDTVNKEYRFELIIAESAYLNLSQSLSNLSINAPINLVIDGKRCELKAPVAIDCKTIRISTNELVVEPGKTDDGIRLECENFEVEYFNSSIPSIKSQTANPNLIIITTNRPDFPFGDYYLNNDKIAKLDLKLKDKYLKLRKIILLFRSHSKGVKAKFKDKINHKRVAGNELGIKILKKLISSGVLYEDIKFYFIDDKEMHTHLGLSYQDLKHKNINDKAVEFLNNID